MSACVQCGAALEEGAAACVACGTPIAAPRSEGASPKWGTLMRVPRAVTGPLLQPLGGPSPLTAARPGPAEPFGRAPSGPLASPLQAPVRAPSGALPQPRHPIARAPSGAIGQPPHPAARAPSGAIRQPPQRAPSGALGHAPHPAARAPSAALGQPPHPAARAPSGALAQPRHPAARGLSGPLTGAVIQTGVRAAPRAPSGPLAMDLPLSAAGEPANANHLDTGMLEIGDEFAGPRDDGPALEVASMKPRRESPRPQRAHAEAPRESNAEQRMRRVRDLARYPAVPPKLVGAIPYFLRVYSRRRELAAQVINLTQQRKRLELASDDALCLLGQALYAKRGDPSLEPLAAQLRVVGESAREVGAKAAAAKRTEQELKHELAGLERELLDAKTGADPVQARETVLSQAVDGHKAQIKRREMMVRKADAELKALKVGSDPQTLEKITTLTAEREQHYGELQSLQVKLIPLEEELPGLRATLAKHNAQVESLQERVRRLQGAMGREHGRERIAAGGSHSAYRDALRSVANLALKHELAECAPAEQRAALEAGKLAAATRESEELMRAAVGCYNERAYQRGMQLLVGSTIGVFLLFALLIAL